MHRGYAKLWRKSLESQVWSSTDAVWKVWCWCLMKANHKDGFCFGEPVKRGEFITGRTCGSIECGMAPSTWYRAMRQLAEWEMISLKVNSKWTAVSICNHSHYNDSEIESDQQVNSARTASEQRADTNKNDKHYKNEKNDKNTQGRAFILPQGFDTEECQAQFRRWFDWLDQHGKLPTDPDQQACAACMLLGSQEALFDAINGAIANDYITLKNYGFTNRQAAEEPFDLMAEVKKALQ